MRKWLLLFSLVLFGCTGIPDGVEPVTGFDIERYLGTWYEIARLDHSFERGLEQVTAHYSLREDGGIEVVNRGFDPKKNQWREVTGKGYFVDGPTVGRLKVSFFGPFYASYNIIALDQYDYSYSLVCGPDKSYLWLLSRTPEIKDSEKTEWVQKAESLGFETDRLIYVNHSPRQVE